VPKLITGYVQSDPDFRYAGEKGTPILKFRVQIGDSWFKRQQVVVFGKLAEKNQTLERGEFVTLSGELKENTFRDESKLEFVIGWQGNFKRHPEKPKKEMRSPTGGEDAEDGDGIVSAPRSYRRDSDIDWLTGEEPVLEECPDYEFPDPTDEDYRAFRDEKYAEFLEWGFLSESSTTDNQRN
jgi:single-stranded DNA-binding protein